MKTPHLHQAKAVDATFEYLATNDGSGLVVAPVAGGKSLIIAETIKRACLLFPKTNCLVLTHVSKLLVQDEKHLKEQFPLHVTSFYSQKLKQKSFAGQTIFASINSIYKRAYNIPKTIDIIFIDEAHLISPDEATMYRAFLKDMIIINPYVRILGYTGTNFRATEGRLTEGEGRLFTDVIYQIPMLYLIEKGFLCPLRTPQVKTRMSVDGVGTRNGDYIESQLQTAVDKDPITKACVDEIIENGRDRNKWLVFTAGIEHCRHVRDEIRSRGVSCEMLTHKDKNEAQVYAAFERGDFKCLVNVSKVTTGVDIPAIDLMAFMRPMRSPVLYVQMAGRGMRIHSGKLDCLLLDFGGVIAELGPVDLVDAVRVAGKRGKGEAPVKLCPNCNAVCFAGVSECPDCGYQFPDTGQDLRQTASTMAVMSNQVEPEWYDVISVQYKSHTAAGKTTPTLCVTYGTLSGQFRDWICYEHIGSATLREKAARWHKQRSDAPLPKKVSEALKLEFREPKRIQTRQLGKHHEVIGYEWV